MQVHLVLLLFVSSLFLVIFQVLRSSVIISSLDTYRCRMLKFLSDFIKRDEEMSSGNDELEAELDAEAKQEASWIFAMHCKNLAKIAKILQP